jgi:hypothetical protein
MGGDIAAPLFERLDWFWPSMIGLGVMSVVMAVVVIVAYVRA